MQATRIPVILTRTAIQAEDFAKALRHASMARLDIRIHPLLAISYLDFTPPMPLYHLIFTSPHGVHAWCARSPWRGACSVIGAQTATMAALRGFCVQSQFTQARDLLQSALPKDAHYIRGEHISHPLPVAQIIAYQQHSLPWSAGPLPKQGAIFPLFSTQSALRLLALGLPRHLIYPIAISAQVAQVLMADGLHPEIAPSPDRVGMIAAILQYSAQRAKMV